MANSISDVYMSTAYINKLISTRLIKATYSIKRSNTTIYETKYFDFHTHIPKDNLVQKKVVKFNEAKWRLSVAFFKFFYEEKVEMLFSTSELQRIAKCSNIRENLEDMKAMGLIYFEDTPYGIKIYLLNSVEISVNKKQEVERKILPYVYLPIFCLDESFFAEEIGVQKLFLYYLANLSYSKNDKFELNKKEVMLTLGISNTSRMDNYIQRTLEILDIAYQKQVKHTYIKNSTINYIIFVKKYNSNYNANKKDKILVKQSFLFDYMSSLINRQLSYTIEPNTIYSWIDVFKRLGLTAFKKTLYTVQKYAVIDQIDNLVNYFIQVAYNNNYSVNNA